MTEEKKESQNPVHVMAVDHSNHPTAIRALARIEKIKDILLKNIDSKIKDALIAKIEKQEVLSISDWRAFAASAKKSMTNVYVADYGVGLTDGLARVPAGFEYYSDEFSFGIVRVKRSGHYQYTVWTSGLEETLEDAERRNWTERFNFRGKAINYKNAFRFELIKSGFLSDIDVTSTLDELKSDGCMTKSLQEIAGGLNFTEILKFEASTNIEAVPFLMLKAITEANAAFYQALKNRGMLNEANESLLWSRLKWNLKAVDIEIEKAKMHKKAMMSEQINIITNEAVYILEEVEHFVSGGNYQKELETLTMIHALCFMVKEIYEEAFENDSEADLQPLETIENMLKANL